MGRQPVSAISGDDLLIATYIAIVPGAVGHFVTTWPLQRVPANVPPVMQLAMPFLAGGSPEFSSASGSPCSTCLAVW